MNEFRDPRSFTVELPDSADVPNYCPQGCGDLTEDEAGGPCKACWRAIDRDARLDDMRW